MVSGSISPPYSGYFSPFPHGTGSLSVSQEYLALADGAACFRRGFTGPALLRVPLRPKTLHARGYHPFQPTFPGRYVSVFGPMSWPYNPSTAVTALVWAVPRSLATTCGITVVFSSSGYLDVSVLRVCLHIGYLNFIQVGCPIRIPADQLVCANPRSFSQLVASFIASESLGIPHAPFSAFLAGCLATASPLLLCLHELST